MLHLTEYQWLSSALGWTILHSLWQITIIGSIWYLVCAVFKKISSSAKYNLSIFAMLLITLATSLTFVAEIQSRFPPDSQRSSNEGIAYTPNDLTVDEIVALKLEEDLLTTIELKEESSFGEIAFQEWLSPELLKLLSFFWICGVVLFGIRFLLQWFGMRRLAIKGTQEFGEAQIDVFLKLKSQLGIKKNIRFLQSSLIASPLTFGHFKPIILLPLGMINGFPPEQIEAIILHELAHIRRNDFLINTIQTWLEILFFYHPVVWIISKKIRSIREELCDDEVIRVNQDTMIYAESLLNLQKYFIHNKNQLVMNATGNKNEFTNRIHRLFQTNPGIVKKKRNMNAYLFGLLMLIVMGSYAFSSFDYPTVSVAVDKMNVFYIGVDNPVTVAVAGVSAEKTKVESDDVVLKDQGNGHYIVTASKPGVAIIKVTADGHAPKELKFRVKRIPDPMAGIGKSRGGKIPAETFKTYKGIDVELRNFLFDASCSVSEFTMTYVAKKSDPVEVINRGELFNDQALKLLDQAKSGDIYYFDKVAVQCPGDEQPRPVNSMVFRME